MKKYLLVILTVLTISLTACGPNIETLEITGTRDRVKAAGEEVDLYKYVKVKGDDGELYNDSLSVTSDNCTITGTTITSDFEIVCNITYSATVGEITETLTHTIDYREEYRELEQITEYNNIMMYQIYVAAYVDSIPGGFGLGYGPSDHNGDLQGVIDSLDYIENLGVNAIWLTPIFESKENSSYDAYQDRGRSTGYYADDYYNIDPNFGTNELFRTLVTEAHNRGLYVILDGVFGHHGSYDIEGVTNGVNQWYGYETEYPESLEYFTDVALFWIDEYDIDGWRMDQAYQLIQENYNYFREIRNAVEDLCAERKAAGEEWGTLGYMVAEIFDNAANINEYAYDQNAFRSAFDFPTRAALVRVLAIDDWGRTGNLSDLDFVMSTVKPDYAQPNLFLTNHDVARFGDLIQLANKEDDYWDLHKMAYSFIGQYTGPITVYYGDEYGDEYEGLSKSFGDLSSTLDIAGDNVARSTGKNSDFTLDEQDLIDYVSTVLELRDTYDSLWNGERDNLLTTDNIYVDLKTSDNNQVLYVLNISSSNELISIDTTKLEGTQLRNLFTDEVITITANEMTFDANALEGTYFIIE